MSKGNIGVTSNNIFPVIKKFLYSDHEIFLRELISNATDATQKLKTLVAVGECNDDISNLKIQVLIDKTKKTLTIRDNGIGMTADELDKYINQIAFSGAEDFVNKYKDKSEAIIGHFGLGFYSSFMVADKVDIFTQSFNQNEKAMHWSCAGDPEYTMEETIKAERGTDIVLYINKEFETYLENSTIEALLKKYCKFLPVPIVFGKKKEWKDGQQVETDEDLIINDTNPAWTRKPADLKHEDYIHFYHELYPSQMEEPLFYIHLNVDYPFHLTGILYFPRIKNNLDVNRNKIQLYCNQVYVTDEVTNIVPDYLTLLHGVLDSPDIPLNVSRSYLQYDQNVKKISNHITKKVADKLAEIFKNDRQNFEKKWEDIKLFIQYGMLSDEKFYERANSFALMKSIDEKYFTLQEYKDKIKENQVDKDGNLVILYANNVDDNYIYIDKAKQKNYDVLLMNGELDVHIMSQIEQKSQQEQGDNKQIIRFARIDSDTIDNLIQKKDKNSTTLNDFDKEALRFAFETQMKGTEKVNFYVSTEAAGEDSLPVFLTQNEFMRRMKEMAVHQQGMNFYGAMPDSYNVIVNSDNEKIKNILKTINDITKIEVDKLNEQIKLKEDERTKLQNEQKDKKEDEKTQDEKDKLLAITNTINDLNDKKRKVYKDFADNNSTIHQLIDLAMLASGMLKGERLSQFLERSVELL